MLGWRSSATSSISLCSSSTVQEADCVDVGRLEAPKSSPVVDRRARGGARLVDESENLSVALSLSRSVLWGLPHSVFRCCRFSSGWLQSGCVDAAETSLQRGLGVLCGGAVVLRTGCVQLILEKLGDASRDGAKADRLHDQVHDPIEPLMFMHLRIGVQEGVVPEPEREGDEQDGQE